jgi:hypothetical protein
MGCHPRGWLESAHRLRVPLVIKTTGHVGCRCRYCFAVEIPFGNPGMCAHSFNELWHSKKCVELLVLQRFPFGAIFELRLHKVHELGPYLTNTILACFYSLLIWWPDAMRELVPFLPHFPTWYSWRS